MRSVKENVVLFSILVFLFLVFREYLWIQSLISVLVLWYFRTRDHSFIYLLLVCMISCIPFYSSAIPTITTGYARKVNTNYSILENGNQKVIVYTESPLEYDGEYLMIGTPQEIEPTYHFFGFNYSKWLSNQDVYYSLQEDDISFVQNHFSIRHWIQNKISNIDDPEIQTILYKSLLNIKVDEEKDWMNENGFSYSGMLLMIDWILKYFIDKKKRNHINIVLSILLMIIYRCPLLVVENLLFRILKNHFSYQKCTGIVMTLIMILYPKQIMSASFLIPAVYRYSFLFQENKKSGIYFCIFILQSLLFQSINIVRTFLYPIIQRLNGLLFMTSLIYLLCSVSLFEPITIVINCLNQISDRFVLNGSILGIGTIGYILCLRMIKKKHFYRNAILLLFFFQLTGLFHPCMELSVINVGQGDSILIRAPMNSDNILIDTGKPSAYRSLSTFLDAKGINTLNTLIITHSDDDHSGNQTNIMNDYLVDQLILTHQNKIRSNIYELLDINSLDTDDENDSSIVNVLNLNDLNVCLMADASEESEKEILKNHPKLSCDVIKLGHHGSKTSSSDKFLDQVQPKIALISSGAYSIYHHPSIETIQKLLKRHIPYFDTKESGDITILCFYHFNLFITSRFEIGLL